MTPTDKPGPAMLSEEMAIVIIASECFVPDAHARAVLAALRSAGLVLEQDWRFDMENAPRDGTKIIVYRAKFDGNYIPQVGMDYWMDGKCWGKSRPDTPPIAWRPYPAPPTDSKGGAP